MSATNIINETTNSILSMIENNIEDTELIKILLKQGEDINQVDENENSLLICSIQKSYLKLSRFLLENGIEINHQNNKCYNALMVALQEGDTESIDLLMEYNINLNHQEEKGKNALMMAIELGFLDIAKKLIENGININSKDSDGRTVLMWAVENGYKEMVQLLIDKGVNLDARNKTGWTALIWASVNGHEKMVELLIKNGVDLNIKNIDGWSALVGAVFKNHYNIAKLLIDNGITINAEDKYLISALIFTYDKGYEKMFELLFNTGVNSENIRDKEGNSTLLMATRLGVTKVVKSLLDNGANINDRNSGNDTALIWATVKNNKEIIKLLLEYKPKLNLINNDKKWSALMYASNRHQTKDIVELLVNAGADSNQTYNREETIKEYPYSKYFNRTSLTLAKKNKYKNINGIEEFLKSKGAIVTS